MVDDNGSDDTDSRDIEARPDSLLPYDQWTEEALRLVMVRALQMVGSRGEMPGGHHFYITFRTDYPGVTIPARLRAQYPQEMTIVLQHQFWDLGVDEASEMLSVGLSFGGVPSTLRIPLAAVAAFADPHVRYGLRFSVDMPGTAIAPAPPASPAVPEAVPPSDPGTPQVVSLDAFRRRPKE